MACASHVIASLNPSCRTVTREPPGIGSMRYCSVVAAVVWSSYLHVCTRRCGGSTRRKSPETENCLPSALTPSDFQLPPGRTSAVHFVTRYVSAEPHHSATSTELIAAKTRSGGAAISTDARISPVDRSATARASPFDTGLMCARDAA